MDATGLTWVPGRRLLRRREPDRMRATLTGGVPVDWGEGPEGDVALVAVLDRPLMGSERARLWYRGEPGERDGALGGYDVPEDFGAIPLVFRQVRAGDGAREDDLERELRRAGRSRPRMTPAALGVRPPSPRGSAVVTKR